MNARVVARGPEPQATDVLLVVDMRAYASSDRAAAYTLPLAGLALIAEGVTIEPAYVDSALPGAIRHACSPPGENFEPPDLETDIYLLRRAQPLDNNLVLWDKDQRLQLCVALSRLVRPTSMSFRFAARIVHSEPRKIVPGPTGGLGGQAWTVMPGRDWLDADDIQQWSALAIAFFSKPLSGRLRRALYYHEYAARSYLLEARCPFVVTALEALLNTSSAQSTAQFVRRIPQLTVMIGASLVSKTRANRMYALRSKLVHGEGINGGAQPKHLALYIQMEELLRLTLRKAILEPTFASLFAEKTSVDAAFPV